ncbi:MAG: UPF0182 family protein [Peptococcaceae bacterium]|nr:UPF0182 family protein [Peptococcaceae bacterium]
MRRLIPVVIVIFILGLAAAASGLYEDWLWFKDLGYLQLFWKPLVSKSILQSINTAVLFVFIAATLLSIRHAIMTFIQDRLNKRLRLVHDMDRSISNLNNRYIIYWLLIISAVVSFLISFIASFTGWLEVLMFIQATPFDASDPVFGRNLSFYFFRLPFMQTLYEAFFAPIGFLTFFTILFYFITKVIRFHSPRLWLPGALKVDPSARRHIAFLFSILFALKAFGYYLDIYTLLYSNSGHVVGAGYTDIHTSLPVLYILIVICVIGFLLAAASLFLKDIRLLTLPVITAFLVSISLYGVYPSLVQSLVVIPNELVKEAPYIQNEISWTRYGYGLDNIQEEDYLGNTPLNADLLAQNMETLNNIRLNDTRPMLQTYTQKQGIRLYYKFHDIDVDRYTVDGEYRQVMLSPREISPPDLDAKAQTFVNLRFKYTHGFGIAASFANAVTPDGLPSFAIKDVPAQTSFSVFNLEQPRIYYGELTNDWVVVDNSIKEFDYPLGNENAENIYEGTTGIRFTPLNKLMLSLQHRTARFYLSSEIIADSRILLHRNIKERVTKLAPFLTYDEDPYLVIDEGRLKWILDAYTTSSALPYSNTYPDRGFNYIRNSVKVVIDAYHGTVDFYALDPAEPLLATYMKIFPDVFKSFDQIPKSLVPHLRYPETLFTIQCNMLKTFHMTNPSVFYNKEDVWDVAKELYLSKPQNMEPYYTILKLPESRVAEYVLMLPFTPASSSTNTRNNMVAWLGARMDGANYGQLILYTLPKNIEIDGPLQLESRIDQDAEISQQLALWDQKGSSVIRGNLLVLPVAGNFLYVEPIYLLSESGSIPEMKRVILAYADRIIMSENLGDALIQIFGDRAPQPSTLGQSSASLIPPSEPPAESNPAGAGEIDMAAILEQINQLRDILDHLEVQLTAPPVSE